MVFGNKYSPIGLDFGSRFVKAVQLRKEEEKPALYSYAETALAAGCLESGGIIDRKALKAALRLLLKKRFKGRAVNFSVSGRQIHLHTALFPSLDKEELGQAAYWEMEQQLKGQMADPVVACLVSKEVEQEGQPMLNVIIAAVPRAVVEDYFYVLEEVGLEPQALEIKQIPLFRVLQGYFLLNGENLFGSSLLALDIGAEETIFVVMNENRIVAAETMDIGVDSPTGFSVEVLLSELKRVLKLLAAGPEGAGGQVAGLYLAGGGSQVEGLSLFLEKNLQMDVHLLESPFVLPPGEGFKGQGLENMAPMFAIALGLCMRCYT
jgi:Tfp pilus assembly PilM family ATPase